MRKLLTFMGLIFAISSCNKMPSYDPERSYKSIEKSLSAKLMLAKDSSVIELEEGHFIFKNSLILEGKNHVTLRGKGSDKTILSFKIQESGAEGLRVANCTNIILEDFAIEDAAGDNIKVTDTDGITFRNIKSAWTEEVNEQNGAYGLYPVLCKNVVIENCEVLGASDAGIYVGQSVNVAIKNNKVYWNVAGIESENSENVIIEGNEAYENTGGILIFDLPGLTMYGRNIKAFSNKVFNNNLKNFAPAGNIVGVVPPGTGFLVLATRDVEIYNNVVKDNKTIGAGIISYDLVASMRSGESTNSNQSTGVQGVDQNYKQDSNYDPYPGEIYIHDNELTNKHFLPDFGNDIGKLFIAKFGLSPPIVAWDGILAPDYQEDKAAYGICIEESDDLKIANLDAANNFENISTDHDSFKCAN
jgi:parallel beta-helix repeat protein